MYNVFISYRRDGGYEMGRLLYEHLKAVGLTPFFDLEELRSGPFNVRLYKTIEECDNVVLVLPPNALDRCVAEDDWLRLEIEHSIAKKKNIVPVMMPGFIWPDNLPESILSLKTYNGVAMSREYFDASIMKLLSMLKGVELDKNGNVRRTTHIDERTENTYFTSTDKKEIRRLRIQQDLMKNFDACVYKKAEEEFDELRILDIGTNNGDFIMDRIGSGPKVKKLIGIEYDKEAVATANKKYGKENEIGFLQANVEADELSEIIETAMDEYGIVDFNVINLSMVLLHLKSPYRILKTVRRYLQKGGMLIVKNIDDGLNIAYPDDNGDFARVVEICAANETSGYRKSGRQVCTLLSRAGYRDTTLEKAGLSTANMDYDQRAALFDTYFSFILEDLKIMHERYPHDNRIQKDLEWYIDAYEDLEEHFQDDNFFFILGFMLFTARK